MSVNLQYGKVLSIAFSSRLLISKEVIRNQKATAKCYWKNFTILQIKSHFQNHLAKLSTIFIFIQQVLFPQDYMVHPKLI